MKKYFRNNRNVFDKVKWVKELASEAIGVSDEQALKRMLGRLRRKGSANVKKYGILRFSQQEIILDQLLKGFEVSPRTAYNWFLLMSAPKEVCELVQENKVSQNQMQRRMGVVLRKSDPKLEKLGKEIIRDILRIVEAM